jgi:propionyl-CoA carboxylase alpha chain
VTTRYEEEHSERREAVSEHGERERNERTNIERVLVANRGEIARRVMRTCRELGIETVAVYSDADADMPHVAEADVAVHLPGNHPADTYLRIDLILDAARQTGADAVHPGYGFLSESAEFATAVLDAGLIWVGPSPHAIATMGSKIEAKNRMVAANVPVLNDATVSALDRAELQAAGEQVGYPLLVKASAGGGGRGMRIVRSPDALSDAVRAASTEAASAFGDGTVFLEHFVEIGRHVEVQIIADQHDTCLSLFERECSIQRRHQKIIEEAPSPAVDAALRAEMSRAAVAAAQAVGYVGVGTVEFLLDAAGRFAFLEMNTRLQVEHPVTELVTGLDLVALQLAVAEGRALPAALGHLNLHGHAIEARLYAEDPAADYAPQAGTLSAFTVPDSPAIRVDGGVEAGSVVSPFYDPMLAKVIAWGPTRSDAIRSLRTALRQATIHGLTTNRDQLVNILGDPTFAAGDTFTNFLDTDRRAERPEPPTLVYAAAALAHQAVMRAGDDNTDRDVLAATAGALRMLPSGWRNAPSAPQQIVIGGCEVRYRLARHGALAELSVDGQPCEATLLSAAPTSVVMRRGTLTHRFEVAVEVATGMIHVDTKFGAWSLAISPRFAEPEVEHGRGSLVAPMPGTVVRVAVANASAVTAGDVLVVIEAMKMQHEIRAPHNGIVSELFVLPGQQLVANQPLLTLTDEHQTP